MLTQSKETNPVKGDKYSQRRQIPVKEDNPVKEDKTTYQQSLNGIRKPIPDIIMLIPLHASANFWAL